MYQTDINADGPDGWAEDGDCKDDLESRYDDYYSPSAENRDYSPSSPWDAPGMSVRDFI